jgi:hypothetical protein
MFKLLLIRLLSQIAPKRRPPVDYCRDALVDKCLELQRRVNQLERIVRELDPGAAL